LKRHCPRNEEAMKKNWILCLIPFLLILIVPEVSLSKDAVKLYLFYSDEPGGLKVNDEIIKPLSKRYPIEVQSFSASQLKNYDLLLKFEKELKVPEKELPAVIVGDKILGGEDAIRKDLEGLVKFYVEKGGVSWPSLQPMDMEEEGWIPRAPTEEDKRAGKIIYAAFVYMPGCLH
jgi:hypothetical protein